MTGSATSPPELTLEEAGRWMERASEYMASQWRRPAGVPKSRLYDVFATFDLERAPDMAQARSACLRLLAGETWCAFLVGGFGNGKTHLTIATLNEWARQGGRGYFIKVPDWLALMRKHAVVEEGQTDSESILDSYSKVGMLALDDLGAEKVTEWGGEQLYRLLDRRYDDKRPTIVTSNSRQADLDPRIISRLREGKTVCHGADLRGKLE